MGGVELAADKTRLEGAVRLLHLVLRFEGFGTKEYQ